MMMNNDDSAQKINTRVRKHVNASPRNHEGRWTQEEDNILINFMNDKSDDFNDWKSEYIHMLLPNKSTKQISERWRKVLKKDIHKGSWTKEEDDMVINHVNIYGPKKWNLLDGPLKRAGKQCRERWVNILDPKLNKEPFNQEQDRQLIKAVEEHGKKWTLISDMIFTDRSPNFLNNRWNSLNRKASRKEPIVGLKNKNNITHFENNENTNGALDIDSSDVEADSSTLFYLGGDFLNYEENNWNFHI